MNKGKQITFLVFIFCCVIILTGCKDSSTPSSRIVGHWKFGPIGTAGDYDEYYFGPIDKNTLTGDLIIVSGGESFYTKWHLNSEEREGEAISFNIEHKYLGNINPFNYKVAKNGQYMLNEVGKEFTRVDNKTKP